MQVSNLTRADEERLAKLQKSEFDSYNFFSCDLTYRDLILLLSSDKKVRSMILEIFNSYNNTNSVTEISNFDETDNNQNDFSNSISNQNYNNNYYDDLQNQISNLQNANDDLQNKNTTLQNENHNLQNTIDDLQSKLDFANNSAGDFKNKYENLVENLSYLKNQNVNLQNELNSANNSVDDLEIKHKKLYNEHQQSLKKIATLNNEINILKQHSMPADFNEMLEILQHLKSQNNLATIWLGDDYANADLTMNIQRFIARAGNWTNIELFWDTLRKQCEITKQEISAQNLKLLTMLIQLYNYSRSDDKRATLLFSLEENSNKYNSFEQMRASFCVSGENVSQELLPGLKSAFDKVIKQAIVITKD